MHRTASRARSLPVTLLLAALPAAAGAVEKQTAEGPPGGAVGSLSFLLGFGDELEADGTAADADPTLAIVPAIERRLGNVVAVGAEWMFVWAKADDAPERRFLMSPHLRVRMSFPVYDQMTFDGMLGVGPTIWTAQDDLSGPAADTRFGWSLRFAFGLSYAFNDAVAAFADLGYYTSTTYGDDLELNLTSIPLTVGLRSQF